MISGRRFLLPRQSEVPGFGLYSYVLFSAQPRDDVQRQRYLKAIEAALSVLPDIDDLLSRHALSRQLNITSIPVLALPPAASTTEQLAALLLQNYDYAAAKLLLNRSRPNLQQGPYLVSSRTPLSEDSAGQADPRIEDLGGVAPLQVWEWVRLFEYLAAGQRSWSDEALRRVGVQLRNVLAVGGQMAPQSTESLRRWTSTASAR